MPDSPIYVRIVVRAASDYLTLADLSRLSQTSKAYAQALVFARAIPSRALAVLYDSCDEVKDLAKEITQALTFETLCALGTATGNLVLNSDASQGFTHWQTDMPNLWGIGSWNSRDSRRKAFATSFATASMWQDVNIRDAVQETGLWYVLAGAVYRRRVIAPGLVSFAVSAQSRDTWKVLKCVKEVSARSGKTEGEFYEPGLVHLFEPLPSAVTRLKIILEGREKVQWSGHFGPCFGYIYLRLVPVRFCPV